MSWEKRGNNGRRYYTRSKRSSGKITREYVGTGELADMARGTTPLNVSSAKPS